MKRLMPKALVLLAALLGCALVQPPSSIGADPVDLESYVSSFDYDERQDMKTSSRELLSLVMSGEAVLLDIRFAEEQAAWGMGFGLKIPLDELPRRLDELPRDKLIVTACPYNDRANIARLYLVTKGFNATYLSDGLLALVQSLRGGAARHFTYKMGPNLERPPTQ